MGYQKANFGNTFFFSNKKKVIDFFSKDNIMIHDITCSEKREVN